MGWFILALIISTTLSLVQVVHLSDKDKDCELLSNNGSKCTSELRP